MRHAEFVCMCLFGILFRSDSCVCTIYLYDQIGCLAWMQLIVNITFLIRRQEISGLNSGLVMLCNVRVMCEQKLVN